MKVLDKTITEILDVALVQGHHAIAIVGHSNSQIDSAIEYYLNKTFGGVNDYRQNNKVMVIEPEKMKSITVEQIRSINHFISLHTAKSTQNTSHKSRAIVIVPADSMTIEAQNSLLKNLEEPPSDTFFVLGLLSKNTLLPTVISRLRFIHLSKKGSAELKSQLKSKYSGQEDAQIDKAIMISNGLPQDIEEILKNAEHPRYVASDTAKKILISDKFERLLMADKLTKQPDLIQLVLELLIKISEYSLVKSVGDSKYWINVINQTYRAQTDLNKNAQTKLVLTRLMLSI